MVSLHDEEENPKHPSDDDEVTYFRNHRQRYHQPGAPISTVSREVSSQGGRGVGLDDFTT